MGLTRSPNGCGVLKKITIVASSVEWRQEAALSEVNIALTVYTYTIDCTLCLCYHVSNMISIH